MNTRKVELGFFFFLAAAAGTVSFFIFQPYLGALFVALVFAIVFRPLHQAVAARVRRAGISAFLTLLFLLLVVLIPATLFGFFLLDDAQRLYQSLSADGAVTGRLDAAFLPVERYLQGLVPDAKIRVYDYLDGALSFLIDNFGGVFNRAVGFVFKAFIMLLALFYLFRDGKRFRSYIIALSPLANEYDERILKRLEGAIASVVQGKLMIIFIQGILASAGFWLFGLPHPVLLGALTSLSALIPAVGVGLVFIPVVLYALWSGGVGAAVGLLVFGAALGAVDNLLGPVLYERGLQTHPLLILLSVLGGLALFGPVGFLAGPVTLSLLLALVDIYPLLFQGNRDASSG